jgi:hypothetical protein
VVFVVGLQSVLYLSYYPLTKSRKKFLKKTRFKVFVVFVVGLHSVLNLSYHPLTKSSKIAPKKPRFKVFVVVVCGVCSQPPRERRRRSCKTDASEKGPDKEIEFTSDIWLLDPRKVLPHPSLDAVHIK